MAVFIYGLTPEGVGETIFALASVFFFFGFLGIAFAFLLTYISDQNYVLKGWVFGLAIWFISYAIAHLYKIPQLEVIPLMTAFWNFIGASVWGITLSLVLKRLDH